MAKHRRACALSACALIGAAVASVLLFLMQICACNPLAYSWDGTLLTGLQFFALAFSLAMWPWMMEEYWQGEGGRVALDCVTLGYFAASCHSRFGSSYKMCALALVLGSGSNSGRQASAFLTDVAAGASLPLSAFAPACRSKVASADAGLQRADCLNTVT